MIRALLFGFVAGWAINVPVLLVFPFFLSRWIDLLFFPAVLGATMLLASGVASLVRRLRRIEAPRQPFFDRRWLTSFIVVALLSGGIFAAGASRRAWTISPEVLMYCLDGATWNIMNPMIERGELPNFDRMIEEGASGVLQSTDPSFSPVVWTTMATGVGPETHGITSFYSTQNHLRAPRFWDVLAEEGETVGVFRWLITWPPREVPGFWVPGILARDASCHPEEYGFINQIRMDRKSKSMGLGATVGYTFNFLRADLRLQTCLDIAVEVAGAALSRDTKLMHVANRRAEIRLNMDVYSHLLRKARPEFTSFYDNGTDVLGHYYWKYYEPEYFPEITEAEIGKYGRLIVGYYVLVDELLGELLEHVRSSTTVMIVSDHGQKADEGPLHHRFFPKTEEILKALEMDSDYYGIVLGSLNYIESVKTNADEKRTSVIDGARQLAAVTVEETGQPLFIVEVEDDARIVLKVSDDVSTVEHSAQVGAATIALGDLVYTQPGHSGTHRPEGVFIARGPDVRSGAPIAEVNLVDIAPTVLYLMDQPLSREFVGRVIWSALTDDYRESNPVQWVESYQALLPEREDLQVDAETMKTLRSLGYIR